MYYVWLPRVTFKMTTFRPLGLLETDIVPWTVRLSLPVCGADYHCYIGCRCTIVCSIVIVCTHYQAIV